MSDNASNLKENESINSPDTPWRCQQEPVEAFPRKWALFFRLGLALVMIGGGVFWILLMIERDIMFGLIMTVVWLAVFGTTGVGALHDSADIIISPRGISRQFFGKEWKSIAWTDVARLGITDVNVMGKMQRMVTVHRMDHSTSKEKRGHECGWLQSLSRRVKLAVFAFNADDFKNRARLIELLNCYIKKYNIGIERKVNSKKTEYYDKL